jgi:hypothetical protein
MWFFRVTGLCLLGTNGPTIFHTVQSFLIMCDTWNHTWVRTYNHVTSFCSQTRFYVLIVSNYLFAVLKIAQGYL